MVDSLWPIAGAHHERGHSIETYVSAGRRDRKDSDFFIPGLMRPLIH